MLTTKVTERAEMNPEFCKVQLTAGPRIWE